MKKILVTGAYGFIGQNLCLALRRRGDVDVLAFGSQDSESDLAQAVAVADVVIHLAGVNRPETEEEFEAGNAGLTRTLCELLSASSRPVPVICSSSTQAERDNAYGASKRGGEQALLDYAVASGAPVYVFRLPNVFGKWSRPNYNTVVATFCHNISRGLPVQVNNRNAELSFAYIDDVVSCFSTLAIEGGQDSGVLEFSPSYKTTLGELHDTISGFRENRSIGKLADLGDPLTKYLYSTYLSFLERDDFSYPVTLHTDDRGWLFEIIKSEHAGQMFVSTTKPGITRGNHYHDTKVEKFCVVQGQGLIHFRHVFEDESFSYAVNDKEIHVVDIPPGYTHSIENNGDKDMVTLFWANEIFEPNTPDTYFEQV